MNDCASAISSVTSFHSFENESALEILSEDEMGRLGQIKKSRQNVYKVHKMFKNKLGMVGCLNLIKKKGQVGSLPGVYTTTTQIV